MSFIKTSFRVALRNWTYPWKSTNESENHGASKRSVTSIENPHNGRNENSQDAVQTNKKSQKCRKSPITVVTHVLQNYWIEQKKPQSSQS